MGIFRQIESHPFQNVNAGEIVQRILKSRDAYEERQRAKLRKAIVEEAAKQKEALEAQSKIDGNSNGQGQAE